MRILLDECVHAAVREAFPGHFVRTVSEVDRRGTPDKLLLEYAQDHFDVFVTSDRRIPRQVRLEMYRVGFVLIESWTGTIKELRPVFPRMLLAAETVAAGSIVVVSTKSEE